MTTTTVWPCYEGHVQANAQTPLPGGGRVALTLWTAHDGEQAVTVQLPEQLSETNVVARAGGRCSHPLDVAPAALVMGY